MNQNYVCDVETHDVKISFHIIRQTDKAQIRVSCIDLCTTIPLLAAVLAAGVVCVSEKYKDDKVVLHFVLDSIRHTHLSYGQ